MRWNEVIFLRTPQGTIYDEIGNPITDVNDRQVYANIMSISAVEYYNAALTGLRPSMMFEINTIEYQNEGKLLYNDLEYNIIRVDIRGDRTRLTCQRVAENVKNN